VLVEDLPRDQRPQSLAEEGQRHREVHQTGAIG
jgi:hypothetical protein